MLMSQRTVLIQGDVPAREFGKLLERGVAALDFDSSSHLSSGPAELA
jgi:hypothetical protein